MRTSIAILSHLLGFAYKILITNWNNKQYFDLPSWSFRLILTTVLALIKRNECAKYKLCIYNFSFYCSNSSYIAKIVLIFGKKNIKKHTKWSKKSAEIQSIFYLILSLFFSSQSSFFEYLMNESIIFNKR